jgi:hypothetical protein
MHRINWNLRYDDPPAFTHNYEINANPGETPASPEGPLVLPGVYTARLNVGGKSYVQTFNVRNDPRSPASAANLVEQHALQASLYGESREAWTAYQQVTAMRTAVAEIIRGNPPADVASAARTFDSTLARVGGAGGAGRGGGGRGAAGPAAPPNFAALVGATDRQLGTLDAGDMAPSEVMHTIATAACGDLRTALASWQEIAGKQLADFNALLSRNGIHAIPAPGKAPGVPACSPTAMPHRTGTTARKAGQ